MLFWNANYKSFRGNCPEQRPLSPVWGGISWGGSCPGESLRNNVLGAKV